MIDAKKMLDQFLNSGAATGVVAGMLGGALANKAGLGGIAKIGGLALVGTLAYQAYNKYKDQQAQLPTGQRAQGGIGGTVAFLVVGERAVIEIGPVAKDHDALAREVRGHVDARLRARAA